MLSSPKPQQSNESVISNTSWLNSAIFRRTAILVFLISFIVFWGYQIDIKLPNTPSLQKTLTPSIQPTAQEIGSYDVLGQVVTKDEATNLLKTNAGKEFLSANNGAVEINKSLIELGRNSFYKETFGNEVFLTDVTGILNGPLNIGNLTKAILSLKGKHTTNLQVEMDRDMRVGNRDFKKGDIINTGLDVPAGSLFPLGVVASINNGKVRVGITCASCHAKVNDEGKIIEGAPNNDLDTGTILALASNSASWFRQTGVNPLQIDESETTYIDATGKTARLPDIEALESAVDEQLLSWAPGNFDSTGDNKNNPSQNPSSYTLGAHPYGWSGFSQIGWFKGLTTLNSNVHATNSDLTTGADSSQDLLGIDKETYLGILLQNSTNTKFRLPPGAKPSEFLNKIDPTPGTPAINEVIKMPTFPKGSRFVLDGLIANSPGMPVAAQLNGMSAYQNSLAPPAYTSNNIESIQQGAKIFSDAGCVTCHSGRYFTNNHIIPEQEIKSQPSRALALAKFPKVFTKPQTYSPDTTTPLPQNLVVLNVPTDTISDEDYKLAYAIGNAGGYKVPSLIGLHVTAPYLHDGGVAVGKDALQINENDYQIVNPDQLGLSGTVLKQIVPDAGASLRALIDRNLRRRVVAANSSAPTLTLSNADGSGHNYWVDKQAGYTIQDQTNLIEYLLSLDDNP
ncbi:hypothetical protein NIES4071_04690 [Calothrix sp. NIES-4071]|nr:hypothetical protein NIES4071_04690 [Calothrix sp. NIES-4071]BAZ54815.1 hypothetical protein NIES4105_04680 [Calothrix sp. NIES-4105]